MRHLAFVHGIQVFGLSLNHCMLKVLAVELVDSSRWTAGLDVSDKTRQQNLDTPSGRPLSEAVLRMIQRSLGVEFLRGCQVWK